MPGVRVRHRTLASCVALVPVISKPLTALPTDICPTCQIVHPCKTVHLWLDGDGACTVSTGVLEELRLGGMPDLEIVSEVKAPPTLRIGQGALARPAQDQKARSLVTLGRGYG